MSSIHIPFDDGGAGRYEIELHPADAEHGDGIVLNADREALLSLAEIFRQMAEWPQDGHVHLGYRDDLQPGPGWLIVRGSGRLESGPDSGDRTG